MSTGAVFDIELLGDTLVIIPNEDLREFTFERLEEDAERALRLLEEAHARYAVLDFCKTTYFGSTALSFFVKLWKRVRQAGGNMVLCNLSDHEMEILERTRMDTLWEICDTRETSLDRVKELPV